MAEWLRRLTRNQIPSGSVGSSPTDREIIFLNFQKSSFSSDLEPRVFVFLKEELKINNREM